MISRYGPNGLPTITVLQGIKDYLKRDVEVVYSKGCNIIDKEWPASEVLPAVLTAEEVADMDKAVSEAQSADVIIAVMGEDEYRVGESRSRTSLELPGRQRELLQALYATGKPVVLVLINVSHLLSIGKIRICRLFLRPGSRVSRWEDYCRNAVW